MSKKTALDLLDMIPPKQAAAMLGCSVKTLSRRNLPAYRDKGIVRYSRTTILEYIKECTKVAKPPEEQPSTPSPVSKVVKHIGSRAGSSLLSGALAKSRRDQSSEALAFISELKARETRSARSGTEKRKNSSPTRGGPSPSRELSKTT